MSKKVSGNCRKSSPISVEDKKKLLENAKIYECLSGRQLLKLIGWEWFNKEKIDIFYNALNMGKAAIYAYRDAEGKSHKNTL